MTELRRTLAFCCFIAALCAFAILPEVFALDANGRNLLALGVRVAGPLVAALLCLHAASVSDGGDRPAWYNFAIGSALYVTGNLIAVIYYQSGGAARFVLATEAIYFLMAGFFAAGILQYGKVRRRISLVQLYNFLLIFCAVVMSALFVLNVRVTQSAIGAWPALVAFLYPALWISVAIFGLISLALYDQRGRRFVLALMLLAVLGEAIADFSAWLRLMDNAGAGADGDEVVLWLASALLIGWAALEQMAAGDRAMTRARPRRDRIIRTLAQAAVPGVAIALVLLTGTLSGTFANGPYAGFATWVALVFAVIAALREYWMIHAQTRMRRSMERSNAELTRSEVRMRAVLRSTSDSVLVVDRDWRVVYFNQHAIGMVSLPDKLKIGASLWDLLPAATTSGERARYLNAVETGQPEQFEIFVEERNIWLDIHAYPDPEGLSIFFRDISERKRVHEEILHLAHHDPLTGLVNRSVFHEQLTLAVNSADPVAVLLLDLDHFKEVNDTQGHPVGDALLVDMAQRLRGCVRAGDTVARLGGDEFAVILVTPDAATLVEQLAERIIAAAATPHHVAGQALRVGVSIGITVAENRGEDPNQILKQADLALYAAKSESPGGYAVFKPAMEQHLQKRTEMRSELAGALEREEFELAFQPLLDLKSDRICGFEALLRWRHPVRGIIGPDSFIPIAEESGLIVPIGDWVLRTACKEAVTWPGDITVAVNLSTRQFAHKDLPDKVADALTQSGLEASRLELELTESSLLVHSKANMVILKTLREIGVRTALDDFGTGYSSLGYLNRFHFSKLKIDRSFIAGLPASEESQAIVEAVIGLGRSLRMRVTAEGIETQEQLDWIRTRCDEAQGYYLGRPVTAREVAGMLARPSAEHQPPYLTLVGGR